MPVDAARSALRGCYVISLRPVGGHAALRRAAAAHGARVLALSPWRIETRHDAGTRTRLREALSADAVLFTSPAAVAAAATLAALRPRRGQPWLAVGAGTAAALQRAGVRTVQAPARMDSEGVLALPALQAVRGQRIALVTAPGGRGLIAAELARRGATVLRADVYARVPVAPAPRAVARLQALASPLLLALSSGEALQHVLDRLPEAALAKLRRARVLAASERLAAQARAAGFTDLRVATDARPAALLAAALDAPAKPAPPSASMRHPRRAASP